MTFDDVAEEITSVSVTGATPENPCTFTIFNDDGSVRFQTVVTSDVSRRLNPPQRRTYTLKTAVRPDGQERTYFSFPWSLKYGAD